MQSALPPEQVPIGATTLLFSMCLSSSVFLAVGQAVFQSRLTDELVSRVPTDNASAIVAAGAAQGRQVVGSGDLNSVLEAYNTAVTNTFVSVLSVHDTISACSQCLQYIPMAGAIVAFLLDCAMKWKSIKKPPATKPEGKEEA